MATVEDAIQLLRDPENSKRVSNRSGEALAVRSERVIGLLHQRGAESQREAIALIRQATRALGGDEVIVRRPSALHADKLGSAPDRAVPTFWLPAGLIR